MGAQYSQVSDNGIKNLNRSDMLTIQFKKESYYEGQVCEGVIIFEPKQRIAIQDILIKFHYSEYIVYVIDEKDTVTELNSNVFFEKPIGAANYLNMNGQGGMISLNPGSYKFPFQFTLPNNIPPSFEYPIRNKRASLRYTFSATVLSPYVKTLTESYIWIKQRPISVPDTIKHENYVNVKNVGIITRGKDECGVQVKEVKISLKRTVTFIKGGQQFQHRTAVLRKKYPCVCNKNSRNSFHYDDIQIRDNEFKDADFNRALNPYPFIDDLNLLMPNMRSKLIKCEYSLKATSYFDLSVFGKSRPRVEMPIYITHQLQKEFEYEKNTNQNNGQGQEFFARDFQRGFSGNNNPFQNNNNNQWGNNNNNNNNNQWGNNNNNNSNNNNNQNNSLSSSTVGSKKFSYEAYIATKKLNNPNQNNNNSNNNNDWKSKSTFQPSSNFGNNNNWNNNNNNNNQWGNNNNNNNWNNNNNNNWNNNNNNNNWNNNNNNNWNNNSNQNKYGSNYNNGNNGSANPFGGGDNDFPSLDNINSNSNNNNPPNPFGNNNNPPNPFDNNNNNNPPNPFGNNNNPPNPFGNNNNNPPNPFGNNNNNNNPPNPFGGNSNPYQNSYPGF